MSNIYRAFPKLMDESNDAKDLKDFNHAEYNNKNNKNPNSSQNDNNYMWLNLKMPEEVNQGGWGPAFYSYPSENSELYKMNSTDRCKVLNDRILQGAMRKCTEMLDRY
jgi:hypothetical protein